MSLLNHSGTGQEVDDDDGCSEGGRRGSLGSTVDMRKAVIDVPILLIPQLPRQLVSCSIRRSFLKLSFQLGDMTFLTHAKSTSSK